MPVVLEKPSQLLTAIAETLRAAIPGLNVESPQDFNGSGDPPWVLIAIEQDAAGMRSSEGRIAHVLTVSLQAVTSGTASAACDLGCELKRLVVDNRWDLPGDQCDLPADISGVVSTFSRGTQAFAAWTLSFTQTLYLGPTLLDDPLGLPKFARTWEVSNIDDPDQYTTLED